MKKITTLLILLAAIFLTGCAKKTPKQDTLIIITPHNESIRAEFGTAFIDYYLAKTGKKIDVQWRNVGGSTTIGQYLNNIYSRSQTSGADVLFGGGENLFMELTAKNYLEKIDLSQDILDNIPQKLGGMPIRDENNYWCAAAVSSFGFIYNKDLLNRLNLPIPQRWEDLGKPIYFDRIMLADPTQSGSIAAAFEIVVQSAQDWQQGWQRLLEILSNSKKFAAASGTAADAPLIGEAPAAVCIDFYGAARVRQMPDKIGYTSPKGQTAFTPDPIGILKNPANRQLADEFVSFVLSPAAQALWAIPAGKENGTKFYTLDRSPVRKDVYNLYGQSIPEYIPNPYSSSLEFEIDTKTRQQRYNILIELVRVAAIDNFQLLKKAKQKLIDSNFRPEIAEIFYALPDNADTIEKISQLKPSLEDALLYQQLISSWNNFFREKYNAVINY